jgi:hypothetical protein
MSEHEKPTDRHAERQKQKQEVEREAFARITTKLASIDGIATSDAVELVMLIQEYASIRVGIAISEIVSPMISGLSDMMKPAKEPWQGEPPR